MTATMCAGSENPLQNKLPPALPLCVDLDDTLILTDTFFMQFRTLMAKQPWKLPEFIVHFAKGGRPQAKRWLAGLFPVDPATLPYRQELIDYLRAEKAKDRKIYLVSATTQTNADRIAAHLGLFDGAYGSDEKTNLKAKNKASFILKNIAPEYVYAGDALADIAVWREARAMVLCGKAVKLREFISRSVSTDGNVPVEACFPD